MMNKASGENIVKTLTSTLLNQSFIIDDEDTLLKYQQMVASYVRLEQCVGVLSDFRANCSYIYSGSFGQIFNLYDENMVVDSAFEEVIFSKIHADDLLERHALELNYFQFLKTIDQKERSRYTTFSRIRVLNEDGSFTYINHRTIYVKSFTNGSIWLSLCLYAPCTDVQSKQGIDGKIMDAVTGKILEVESYGYYGKKLLTKRELEILTLVAQGEGSKQIAETLNIALHTVHRHRQNIINKMQVSNTTEAVKTALVMGIISI